MTDLLYFIGTSIFSLSYPIIVVGYKILFSDFAVILLYKYSSEKKM